MEWMDGRNFSPVFYMIFDPLGPLPKKKEKQMGEARAKREGSETAQGLAQTLKSLALASYGLALAFQGQAPISKGLALASQACLEPFRAWLGPFRP